MFDLQLGYKQTIQKSASPGKESSKANIFSRWRHPQQVSLLGAVYFKHIKNAARISKVESQIWYMSNHVKSVNSKRFHLRCFIFSLMMLLSGAQINTEPEPPRFRQYDQDRDGVWSSGELSFLVLQATFCSITISELHLDPRASLSQKFRNCVAKYGLWPSRWWCGDLDGNET